MRRHDDAEHDAENAEKKEGAPRHSTAREWYESLLVAGVFVLFVRTFVVQTYQVPTGSMERTILVGDHLLVNKFAFAPRIPALAKLLPYRDVKPGDIIVFKKPGDDVNHGNVLVKRAVAKGGDVVQVKDKRLFVNGKPYDVPSIQHIDPETYPDHPNVPDMAAGATSSAPSTCRPTRSSGWATTGTTRWTAATGERSRGPTSSDGRPFCTGRTRPSRTRTSGGTDREGPPAPGRRDPLLLAHAMGSDVHGRPLTDAGNRPVTHAPVARNVSVRRSIRGVLEPILAAVVFALFARTFLFQAFEVPSPSMEKSVLTGDRLVVNKFVYAPSVSGPLARLLPRRSLRRGDVIVFRFPRRPAPQLHQARHRPSRRDGHDRRQARPCRRPRAHRALRVPLGRPDVARRPGDLRRSEAPRPAAAAARARRLLLPARRQPRRLQRQPVVGARSRGSSAGPRLLVYWSLPPAAGGAARRLLPLDAFRRTRWAAVYVGVSARENCPLAHAGNRLSAHAHWSAPRAPRPNRGSPAFC
jgi:signal peptidase I